MNEFPNILKTMRMARGMTQEALADAIGTAKSTISMYERGKREPDFETLEALADVFNVPLTALLSNDTSSDAELWEIRETLRRRPEMRTLFSLGKNATTEQVRQAIAIIEALNLAKNQEPSDS